MVTKSTHLPDDGLVPIRTVATLTGVNPVTLRAWERRYDLIRPVRTPKGHRLYSMEHVELIQKVLALLDAGMSIGQVHQVLGAEAPTQVEPFDQPDPWRDYRRAMVEAIARFDDEAIDATYNDALSLYPVDLVTSRLVVPLLDELGQRWAQREGSVAEEHFFACYMRNKLGARLHHLRRQADGPRLLCACLPGEHHEIGLLLFALAAMDRNCRVVLLGADTPLGELPAVVRRTGADAIVVAGSLTIAPSVIRVDLAALARAVTVPVFVGGKVTQCHPEEIARAGALALGEDLGLALRTIRARLRRDDGAEH